MNQAFLSGHVGAAPEVRTLPSGKKVAKISLATSSRFKKDDQVITRTEWHRLEVWGKTAEFVEKYVGTGDQVTVSGEIRYDQYEKDNQKVYATKIVVDKLELNKKGGEKTAPAADNNSPVAAPAAGEEPDDLPF